MKIKNLHIKTFEGFEIKNLERGYSMEWGEGGSLFCEIYHEGELALVLWQAGEGGCAIASLSEYGKTHYNNLCFDALTFLKRKCPFYQAGTGYKRLINKNYANLDDDDFENLACCIEDWYIQTKSIKKYFKKGAKTVVLFQNETKYEIVHSESDQITADFVNKWLNQHPDMCQKYSNYSIITKDTDLSIL